MEENKQAAQRAVAQLKKAPVSARKMALLATLIRGRSVVSALGILKNRPTPSAVMLKKLLLSVVGNWELLYSASFESAELFIAKITVDRAGMLKRIMPSSKGMAHRIRRRFSHVNVVVESPFLNESGDKR